MRGLAFKRIVMPTVPKIALYAAMAFIVPGVLKICTNGCANKIVPFAGYRLITSPGQYMLSFPRMFVLFATAYIAATAVIAGGKILREKNIWSQKQGKV